MSSTSIFLTVLLLVVVGAFIGGITNHLAIKMLFRPYRPMYIGNMRVPFTPGVIPKRHDEIAVQLGNLVMKHLITAEGLEKRFLDETFKGVIQEKITEWVKRYLDEKRPTKADLAAHFPIESIAENLESTLIQKVEHYFGDYLEQRGTDSLEEVMPPAFLQAVEGKLPDLSKHFAESIRDYFKTDEAKAMVKSQLDKFFEGRGMLGNMLNMFLGNQSLVDFVYPDLLKFLERPTVQMALQDLLEREWNQLKERSLEDLNESFHLKETFDQILTKAVQASPLRAMIESPGATLSNWKEPITEQLIPIGIEVMLKKASSEAARLLQSLELDQLVSDQVREFSMQELEQVILMISKKEFKMITYLGALLGGIIGLVQALIMVVIQH